ncbi:MAG TPA: bifunctional UDP-N-acetylglucosamine diphosphorylase/glucosamine-1-phosphate N-acetyltransferase GlmU [Candidatus Acidoferrales bacterium]|nr:bifunctional UDP-N-acetylglucosamine diphosphorylase/glucosamine-1-phosphate N-acetyltransferase GlmU [Candidatus Acidoferrales bacterium]
MGRKRAVGAVVLAGGLGTRMRSQTAKVLHALGGRPLISYPLAALRAAKVDPIVVIVGHQAHAVRDACAPYNVRTALQREQRGTGHAVAMARSALGDFHGDLLLVYGDLPFLRPETFRRLATEHQRAGAAVSLLTETVDNPSSFGRIARDPAGRVIGIVEERDCTAEQRKIREINVGVYCADSDFLFSALRRLKPNNVQGELYLTDIIAIARNDGARIAAAAATSGEGTQISDRRDLAACEQILRDKLVRHWMDAGVTFEDPAGAYIGPDVKIGRDTIIGPNAILRGATTIGRDCRIDGSCMIKDSKIGDRVHVRLGVVINEAEVAADVLIGPFAQLRPGTKLGAQVHIGNFVETKNALLKRGVKANHLAYLGDTEIGDATNIGAGTITCNYDGFVKARTVIGKRVQVGSDSQLIAPISIGDDVYIATGTTVRKDVAAGALVFNPKPQMERDGWTAVKRKSQTRQKGRKERRKRR